MTNCTITRRQFVQSSAAAAAALTFTSGLLAQNTSSNRRLNVGLIGCGGRGTGAAANALEASPNVHITALADVFPDRLAASRSSLQSLDQGRGDRARVADDHCFTGFDAYQKLLATDLDLVILATPPYFRPTHLRAAIERGVHAFVEKPIAVDSVGVRSVLESAQRAKSKRVSIVAGTQRRHERSYQQAIERIQGGAIGRIVSASCYWNQGGLWMNPRQPAWSDMEWQLRNWLYFTWLSGDHIVEQHVHSLDVMNWLIGANPTKADGMGGRQVRTSPDYGHIFDHFAVEFEYPDGVQVTSLCRQIDGCSTRVEEVIRGTRGTATLRPGFASIEGEQPWTFDGPNNNPFVQEMVDLVAAIENDKPVEKATGVANATLTSIMGRMTAYTGKTVTWDHAINSQQDLSPPALEFGTLPTPDVAMPGRTPLI